MPLSVLVPLVVIGIGGIVVFLHALGWSRRFELGTEAVVRDEWSRHFPEDQVAQVWRAPTGLAALVITPEGPGLLRSFGADTVAHRIRAISPDTGGLRVDFGDFAAPGLRLALPEAIARDWLAAVGGEGVK